MPKDSKTTLSADIENSTQENDISIKAQLNVLVPNELNAIANLPEPLADRAMSILEKSLEYRRENDKSIIELESKNLQIKESDIKTTHLLNAFGMVSFLVMVLTSLFVGVFLMQKDMPTASYFSFSIGILALFPRIIDSIRKKKH